VEPGAAATSGFQHFAPKNTKAASEDAACVAKEPDYFFSSTGASIGFSETTSKLSSTAHLGVQLHLHGRA
jgi:hypothetical protein